MCYLWVGLLTDLQQGLNNLDFEGSALLDHSLQLRLNPNSVSSSEDWPKSTYDVSLFLLWTNYSKSEWPFQADYQISFLNLLFDRSFLGVQQD